MHASELELTLLAGCALTSASGDAGFVALNAAVGSLPGVQDRHLHALFRELDSTCSGTLPPEHLADAVYGPVNYHEAELVKFAFQVFL